MPWEALECLDGWLACRQLGQPGDLAIEVVAPLQLVEEQRVVLAEHQAIGRRERRLLGREMLEPAEMRGAPVRALAKHLLRGARGT